MQRGLAVLAVSAVAGVLAGPLAAVGSGALLCLGIFLHRPGPLLGLGAGASAAVAALGGVGRPDIWWGLAALAAVAWIAAPVLRDSGPPRIGPDRLLLVLATIAFGAGGGALAAALHPRLGAAVVALALAAVPFTLLVAEPRGSRDPAPGSASTRGALALALASGLAALLPAWPALGPLDGGPAVSALVALAETVGAQYAAPLPLSPAAGSSAEALALAAVAGTLDVPPVWLVQPLAATLAATSAAALCLLAGALWPNRFGTAAAFVLLAFAIPWTSPLARAWNADLPALLALTAGATTLSAALRARAGARAARPALIGAAAWLAVSAPPLGVATMALAVWALPRLWAAAAASVALLGAVAGLAVAGPAPHAFLRGLSPYTLTLAALLALVSALAVAQPLAPRLLPGAWVRVGVVAVALAVVGGGAWLGAFGPTAAPPRPAELLLLEQLRRTAAPEPVAYVGDEAGARWAAALSAGCDCGPLARVDWDTWRAGSGPPRAFVQRFGGEPVSSVLVLARYDASALVRRATDSSPSLVLLTPGGTVFGDEIAFSGWDLPARAAPGDDVVVRFRSEALRPGSYLARLALRGDESQELATTEVEISAGPSERREYRWSVNVPLATPTQVYRLEVAVFADGVKLPASTPEGGLMAGTIVVTRSQDVLPTGDEVRGQRVGELFGGSIELVAYELPSGPLPARGSFPVILYWRARERVGEDLPVFVHLARSDGRPLSQADGYPLAGRFPTSFWLPGEVVRDERRLQVPAEGGEYEIRVGLYRYRTMERLRVPGTADDAWPLARVVVGP